MSDAPPAVDPAPAAVPTAYDEIVYPTAIFIQTSPDRAAVMARLAGLSPPAIETARVLEIGCGDGMNLSAFAAAWPDAEFVGFDLAPTAIDRGRERVARAGLTNLTLHHWDIREAATQLTGKFDYIIAHGVYAWVPADVRSALMALIGQLLSDDGVGYVSYNALPGGYMRLALRDALHFHLDGLTNVEDRLDAAYQMLSIFAVEMPPESPFQAAMRAAATLTNSQAREVLYHDELGEVYEPQSLSDVASAAARVGLRFLGEASNDLARQIFLPDDLEADSDIERQIVRQRQAEDYRFGRFFRNTLLVRDHQRPNRRFDPATLATLYATTTVTRVSKDSFRNASEDFEIGDAALLAAMVQLTEAWPARVAIADLALDAEGHVALFELFDAGHIQLHTTAEPFAVTPGAAPEVSPLVRTMIADENLVVCTLDHRVLKVADSGPRELIMRLDGTLSGDSLAEAGAAVGLDTPEQLAQGLRRIAQKAILVR